MAVTHLMQNGNIDQTRSGGLVVGAAQSDSTFLDAAQLANGQATEQQETIHKRTRRILQQGPWDEVADPVSTEGASSLPMPVEIASEDSLAPFYHHLGQDGTHETLNRFEDQAVLGTEASYKTELIEYPKGVLYADGRLDLCKMVVGPTHIQALMDNLRLNTFVKHFLLGNNIIGAVGARAITDFVNDLPERIETWYLAGNCINAFGLELLVGSWINSPIITNLWLKRNPLGKDSAQALARLICHSPLLRTLDLDQTHLSDAGVAALFAAAEEFHPAQPLPLRHLYLNATGMAEQACQQLSYFLASLACALESLYISCNPIGDAVSHLANGFKDNKSLQRLSMDSCGLKSASLSPVLEALSGHPSLRVLSLGQAFATEDLGARFNWIEDDSLPQLIHLVRTTNLQYLELGDAAVTVRGVEQLTLAVADSPTMLYFSARSLYSAEQGRLSFKARQREAALRAHCMKTLEANVREIFDCSYDEFIAKHKRFVLSSTDVRLIDSVYRNRDANLARRKLKVLDKHWPNGDDTALRAELGVL